MPIIVPGTASTTTTVQNIIDGTAQDVRQLLSSQAGANTQSILIDYVNRVHLTALRQSNWQFLTSAPQRFMTQMGVTDYWIGAPGANPIGTYDTGLGLTDLRRIHDGSVMDRTNYLTLFRVIAPPNSAMLATGDEVQRMGRPRQWRNAIYDTPYVLNIYPAPDNQCTFQPTPGGAICTLATGGNLPARYYYVQITYVDSFGGESNAGPETKIYIPANYLLSVGAPTEPASSASGVQYSKFNVYASTVSGSENQQTVSPLANYATFTEPTTGLVNTGKNAPKTNSLEPLEGYLIEFYYYKVRQQLTQPTDILQVPDDYKDIMIAGVNALACAYLKRPQEYQQWQQTFMSGLGQMVRDKHLFPQGGDFIAPDSASVSSGDNMASLDYFDPGTRTN